MFDREVAQTFAQCHDLAKGAKAGDPAPPVTRNSHCLVLFATAMFFPEKDFHKGTAQPAPRQPSTPGGAPTNVDTPLIDLSSPGVPPGAPAPNPGPSGPPPSSPQWTADFGPSNPGSGAGLPASGSNPNTDLGWTTFEDDSPTAPAAGFNGPPFGSSNPGPGAELPASGFNSNADLGWTAFDDSPAEFPASNAGFNGPAF